MAEQPNCQVPPLPAYPSEKVQSQLLPEEWQSCLDIWVASLEWRLTVPNEQFSKFALGSIEVPFLLSYLPHHPYPTRYPKGSTAANLHKLCYLLLKKVVSVSNDAINPVTLFELLCAGSVTFASLPPWMLFLKSLWSASQSRLRKAIDAGKAALSAASTDRMRTIWLEKISALTKSFPQTATITVASADYPDTLTDLYKLGDQEVKRSITKNIYYSFIALLNNKHIPILTDDIYHLKSEADRLQKSDPNQTTPLSSLLCTTSFLRHFVSNTEVATKKHTLTDQLSSYRQNMLHLHPMSSSVKQRKGKGKAREGEDHSIHMHQAAQVSQIHELFPHLSTIYVMKVLDYFSDNTESSIAALLEPDSLPSELRDQNIPDDQLQFDPSVPDLAPRSTPPLLPERKNVFDDDEFDRLQISSKQIRRGKKDLSINHDATDDHARSKAAIMSALAAFDSDDDERDDTYDVADIGGTVDNTVDTDERRQPATDANEGALYKSWKENPELFARDSKTRASNIRQQLKRETNMTDEQIEGWAIMLGKDKKQQDRLQDKYSDARAFSGNQRALQATRWQASASTENSETESGPERSNDSRRMGQDGIRGHRQFGRGRGRGGGSTSGPGDDAATQAARKRKEQGRGRGGANSRRDARAKKVGRGMGPLPPS